LPDNFSGYFPNRQLFFNRFNVGQLSRKP
jgi:hypothetical protein